MIRKPGIPNKRNRTVKRFAYFALLLGLLLGCAAAPVQEMSDARQTIEAARDAGAARLAPVALAQAERLLNQATRLLERGSYEQARQRAQSARQMALEARRRALEKGQ